MIVIPAMPLPYETKELPFLIRSQEVFHHLQSQTTMNFVSGMPVLFGFAMYTGGPQAAFANWTMVGGLSFFVSLAMAEIAASLPTAGGIYYWSYRLGGDKFGALLSWLTGEQVPLPQPDCANQGQHGTIG